jgi:tRNA-uridine 2-sulfurtransferase
MTTKALKKNKVVLGLSGGVDSTTAALLLQQQGMDIIGLYFDVKKENLNGKKEAEAVAKQMNIPLIYKNVQKMFDDTIIGNFCNEYNSGRTPNPCILCNPTIKFKLLEDVANEEGAYHIATGHYANVIDGQLHMAKNVGKDQSYMLYRLPERILERLILPLGEVENKEEVRRLARANQMGNAEKKDSQEICFIDSDKEGYIEFLQEKGIESRPGNFIDKDGITLGAHMGLIHYTIGQRKGLGKTFGKPTYVIGLEASNNTVMLGDNIDLMNKHVVSRNHIFLGKEMDQIPICYQGKKLTAKIRYASQPASVNICANGSGLIETYFEQPQRAVTPGQSIVFYHGSHLIGGGIIEG